jgi:hypothetical protein
MSISGAVANALSGLTASARSAEVISSNIANAMTDGYGRREVVLGFRRARRGTARASGLSVSPAWSIRPRSPNGAWRAPVLARPRPRPAFHSKLERGDRAARAIPAR